MFRSRTLYAYLSDLWGGRPGDLVPLRIPEGEFPEGIYDPHYDFVRLFLKNVERGAALSMVSAFEIALTDAIRASIAQDDRLHAEMFRDGGPLGNLGTKIKLGFLLKIYSRETMSDFERIARIRNLFAHEHTACDFSHQRIKGLTEAITLTKRAENSDDPIAKAASEKLIQYLGSKDLSQPYFAFMANVIFASTYLGTRQTMIAKHGLEISASIF